VYDYKYAGVFAKRKAEGLPPIEITAQDIEKEEEKQRENERDRIRQAEIRDRAMKRYQLICSFNKK
jgi:phosphopantetheine adenylyltransferase